MEPNQISILGSIGRSIRMTAQLKVALLAVLVFGAFISAMATWLLPFEVVDGQVQPPPPIVSMDDFLARATPTLLLYILSLIGSVYLLGGIIAGLGRLLRKSPFNRKVFFQDAYARLMPMTVWGLLMAFVCLGSGLAVAFLVSFLWAISGQLPAVKSLIGVSFFVTAYGVGVLGAFSPILVADKQVPVWKSYLMSARFVLEHKVGVTGLIFLVSLFGAVLWWVWVAVAAGVSFIREAMGIAEFAIGLPVFFFNLILGFPAAFLTVFIPAALMIYYTGNPPKPAGSEGVGV